MRILELEKREIAGHGPSIFPTCIDLFPESPIQGTEEAPRQNIPQRLVNGACGNARAAHMHLACEMSVHLLFSVRLPR